MVDKNNKRDYLILNLKLKVDTDGSVRLKGFQIHIL
jgi:hypothetical protein